MLQITKSRDLNYHHPLTGRILKSLYFYVLLCFKCLFTQILFTAITCSAIIKVILWPFSLPWVRVF